MLKKLIFLGIPLGILTTLFGWATCGGIFSWVYEIEPSFIWKSPAEMNIPLIWLFNFIMAMIAIFAFSLLKDKMIQKCKVLRGVSFGLTMWLIAFVPPVMGNFLWTVIAQEVLIYQLAWGFVAFVLQGIIISAVYDKACPMTCCGGNCSIKKK